MVSPGRACRATVTTRSTFTEPTTATSGRLWALWGMGISFSSDVRTAADGAGGRAGAGAPAGPRGPAHGDDRVDVHRADDWDLGPALGVVGRGDLLLLWCADGAGRALMPRPPRVSSQSPATQVDSARHR